VNPSWQSSPQGYVSTGCCLRDLDGDGYPDLVVANGNDMARQPVTVYRNLGGTFPVTPTWVSEDSDYCGHCDLADVDGDGKLDLAVAVYLGRTCSVTPGCVQALITETETAPSALFRSGDRRITSPASPSPSGT